MRAIIAILDSFGIGATDDAVEFNDHGSDTFGHIVEHCANAEKTDRGPLQIPNLLSLGLGLAAEASRRSPLDLPQPETPLGRYGYAAERSYGKDTPSGHWEIAGTPVEFDWGYFKEPTNSFPPELLNELCNRANLPGTLGNKHASGTVILDELGAEHIASGKPIAYTSADSVFQIAAHEEHFGLDRLYNVCAIARDLVDDYHIGRVIARPFVGSESAGFERTGNRRDYATPPPAPTLLDHLTADGGDVVSIGKVADIFANQGISKSVKAHGNEQIFDVLLSQMAEVQTRSLLFANFVDFDTLYGHRRDIEGYAEALEHFDRRLPELLNAMRDDDLLVLSADHGCDPTWPGTDHTREHIPVIAYGKKLPAGFIGKRDTFADIGQSIATHLGLHPLAAGTSFID